MPIRLKEEFTRSTEPLMSEAVVAGLTSLKLPATIVFFSVNVPLCICMPPPLVTPLSLERLPVTVALVSVAVPALSMPPPLVEAVLPLIVLLVTIKVAFAPALLIPPPLPLAVLPLIVLFMIVKLAEPLLVASLKMPPPSTALLPLTATPVSVSVP